MKRLIFSLLLTLVAVAAFAQSKSLAIEKFFDGRYNSNPEISTTISKSQSHYYRGMEVGSSQKQVIDAITKAVDSDKKNADNVMDKWEKGQHEVILRIKRNGQFVNVGLETQKDGSIEVFISGPTDAFK